LQKVPGIEKVALANPQNMIIRVPVTQAVIYGWYDNEMGSYVTQAVIYGWYDNEMGSYVNMLGDRTVSIAENM
jgi:glyceraldehyde-3-phosphate dehydrogenase/erythrose-4-phosphate dehydrogenase